ncbi:transforming growth factor-beta-induced protein ig-h3 [Cylas formicarius]|uniref:transforming growth factor-beta-induced protein ig-h3 n=1 Tax=Cylas formicarius TaxID=197179 RepID=UPI00295883D9|nr:transforming growth factor-beta-induced protein ig-h3 [Cylas formicarius]
MLWRAFFASALLILAVKADLYSDLSFFHNPDSWIYETPRFESRSAGAPEKDREPLAPDYKDPVPSATEQKPVLNPKETKEKHPVNPVIPGGVIDVDANGGFPSFSSPFGPEFDFPGLGGKQGGVLGFGGLFGIDDSNSWWKGKNVCIEREESTDDDNDDKDESPEIEKKNNSEVTTHREPNFFSTSIRLSNCFESENKYECTTKINNHGVVKTFTVRYKCCYGFKRLPDSNGCTKQVDLKPILQTLEDLKLDEFRNLIRSSNLDGKFEEGNFTLFVPSDDAVHDYSEKINEVNNVEMARRRRAVSNALSSKDLVLSHSSEGFIELTDLDNEQLLESEDGQKSPIRINIYPTHSYEKMLTANCARVKKGNILADNGIVHILDRVVPPASEDLLKIIGSHPKLTFLRQILEKTDIPTRLKPDGHYTIFAPTDDAFNKVDENQRQKFLNGGGCASNILKHHIVAHTVCSTAIIGNATTHNVEGSVLNMERTMDDELIFEGKAKIIESDVIGTNGVIHLIDNLIVPESGQYIENVLKAHNFSKFQELVEKAGLTEELNDLENGTVFVPFNKAFENPEAQKLLEEIGNDQEKLKDLVRYHAVEGQMASCDMKNNLKLATRDNGKELRLNLYSTLPLFTNVINRATINCARMIGFDEKTCGSMVHEVNQVLIPPTKTIYELISDDERYSTLRQLLQGTEVETILREDNRSITFLAPTDETFAALDEDDRKQLLENKEKAEEVLKTHVLTEVLCCSGVGPNTWGFNSFIPTLGSQKVEVGRMGSQVRINRAVVTSCDNLATNGVLHTINKVLAPKKTSTISTIGGGFFLFDL